MKSLRERLVEPVLRLLERPLPPPTERELQLIREFRGQISQLDTVETSADEEWRDNMTRLTELALSEDPRQFLHWKVVRKSMFVANAPYIRTELNQLRRRPDWATRWEPALKEDDIGGATPSDMHPGSSGNRIHLTYDVASFEDAGGVNVRDIPFIFEFGGGYGGMCRQMYQLGFQGTYVVFDLPHFSALQQYYLRSLDLNVVPGDSFDVVGEPSVSCISCPNVARHVVSMLDDESVGRGLFLATWSFSECPVGLRESFLDILGVFGNTWIGYQDTFNGIDNVAWFQALRESRSDVSWMQVPIEHSPGNCYLTGTAGLAQSRAA